MSKKTGKKVFLEHNDTVGYRVTLSMYKGQKAEGGHKYPTVR